MEAWRYIIDWSDTRGFSLEREWPKRELERLRREGARTTDEARGESHKK